MLRIFCAVSMVVAIAMGMSACQDRNSTDDDGTHGSNDPATTQQMEKSHNYFRLRKLTFMWVFLSLFSIKYVT